MAIKCCKDCVPPTRYPGCHAKCEQYKAEKLSGKRKRPKLVKTRLTQSIQATLKC